MGFLAGKGSVEVVASVILEDTIGLDTSTRLSVSANARMGQAPSAAVGVEAEVEAAPASVVGAKSVGSRAIDHAQEAEEGQQAMDKPGGMLFFGGGSNTRKDQQWRHGP